MCLEWVRSISIVTNYWRRLSRSRRMLSTEADNMIRDLQNVFIIIIHSKYLPPYLLVDFLLNFGLFFSTVSGYKHSFFLSDYRKNVGNIHRATCFAYFCFPSVQLSDSRESHCFCSLVNKRLGRRAWKQDWSMVYCLFNLVSNQYTIDQPSFQLNTHAYNRVDGIQCSHLPNLVNASWLWRIGWEFWANQNRWNSFESTIMSDIQ